MKKITILIFIALIALSLTACFDSDSSINNTQLTTDEATEKSETQQNSAGAEDSTSSDEQVDTAETDKILVAYFSATNNTKKVAQLIADAANSSIYEITPEIPYTADDLDYGNSSSRTSIEMNDPSARPSINGTVENMEQYDIVFIGYPIWWGEAPRIIDTFVESYDFSNKTIVPFCTSGSSGIATSVNNLKELAPDANWLSGDRLDKDLSHSEIVEWINSLGLNINPQ